MDDNGKTFAGVIIILFAILVAGLAIIVAYHDERIKTIERMLYTPPAIEAEVEPAK